MIYFEEFWILRCSKVCQLRVLRISVTLLVKKSFTTYLAAAICTRPILYDSLLPWMPYRGAVVKLRSDVGIASGFFDFFYSASVYFF